MCRRNNNMKIFHLTYKKTYFKTKQYKRIERDFQKEIRLSDNT